MNTLAVTLTRNDHGWAVTLTNGLELARFNGPFAWRRAVRYLESDTLRRQILDVC